MRHQEIYLVHLDRLETELPPSLYNFRKCLPLSTCSERRSGETKITNEQYNLCNICTMVDTSYLLRVFSVIYLKVVLLRILVSNCVEYFKFYAWAVSQIFAE